MTQCHYCPVFLLLLLLLFKKKYIPLFSATSTIQCRSEAFVCNNGSECHMSCTISCNILNNSDSHNCTCVSNSSMWEGERIPFSQNFSGASGLCVHCQANMLTCRPANMVSSRSSPGLGVFETAIGSCCLYHRHPSLGPRLLL